MDHTLPTLAENIVYLRDQDNFSLQLGYRPLLILTLEDVIYDVIEWRLSVLYFSNLGDFLERTQGTKVIMRMEA